MTGFPRWVGPLALVAALAGCGSDNSQSGTFRIVKGLLAEITGLNKGGAAAPTLSRADLQKVGTAVTVVEPQGLTMYMVGKSFTPIPFKFIAIAACVASMYLLTFTVAAVIGRLLHFVIVAALVMFWGSQLLQSIDRYHRWLVGFGLLTAIGLAIVWSLR